MIDRYETFVGWRYLFSRRRRSRAAPVVTGVALLLMLTCSLLLRALPSSGGGGLRPLLAMADVVLLLVLVAAFFTNFFSVFAAVSITGVCSGVAALTVVLSVTSGFQEEFQRKVLGLNAHAIVMKYGLDFAEYRDVIKQVESVPHVKAAAPFVFNEMMLSHGPALSGVIVKGIVPGASDRVLDLDQRILGGVTTKVLASPDKDGMPRILLGSELARKLKVKVGDTVRMISPLGALDPSLWAPDDRTPKMRELRVAGIFYFGFDEYDRRLVVVSLPEAQAFLEGGDVVTGVEMRIDDIYRSRQVTAAVEALLDRGPYRVIDWRELNHNLFTALGLQKMVLTLILVIIVFVAASGIVATLTMLVIDKTREIAILKSLGMRSSGVARLFLTAGMTIGALGTAAGIGLGLMICRLVSRFGYQLDSRVYLIDRLPVQVRASELAVTAAVTLLICFVATIYPSLRAASLHPVEGLRYE